jgi:uncharacterized membrane protein
VSETNETTQRVPEPSLIKYTTWIYGLHSLAVLIGVLTSASIAGKFVFGLPSIIAVIMNYVRRNEARGTFLEAHFRWQIRTFWFALLWVLATVIISLPLMLALGFGFVTAAVGMLATGAWVIYRIARGWMALRDGKPVNPAVVAGA